MDKMRNASTTNISTEHENKVQNNSTKTDVVDGGYRKRGMITALDLADYTPLTLKELEKLLVGKEAWKRTVGVRLLGEQYFQSRTHHQCISVEQGYIIDILLEQLSKEKALYTRLEICQVLEQGDLTVASKMISYLGKIGHNQYHELPNEVSKKKSYPLPRDIIARTLGNMKPDILPVLLHTLSNEVEDKITECIDAFGFLLYYHKDYATKKYAKVIYNLMEQYSENTLIYWKCVICLSAFSYAETIDLLTKVINDNNSTTLLYKEAQRSKKLIERRIQHE